MKICKYKVFKNKYNESKTDVWRWGLLSLMTCWHRTETFSLGLLVRLRRLESSLSSPASALYRGCWKRRKTAPILERMKVCYQLFFFLILYYLKYFTCVSFSPPLTSGHSQIFFKRGGFLDWGGVFSQAFPLPPLGGHCSPLLLSHWMWGKRWFLENAFCPFPSCLLDWAWRPGLVLNKGLDVRTNQTCLPLNNVISKERSQPWNKPGFK